MISTSNPGRPGQPLGCRFLAIGLLCAWAFWSGCAARHPTAILTPVGPSPGRPALAGATKGSLVVYSACKVIPAFGAPEDIDEPADWGDVDDNWVYTRYKILFPDGKTVQVVNNNTGETIQRPREVELVAGRYTVIARADGCGLVQVPVAIVPGRVTVLHLDAGGFWPRDYGFNETNSVHLPNGNIAGWRFETAAVDDAGTKNNTQASLP